MDKIVVILLASIWIAVIVTGVWVYTSLQDKHIPLMIYVAGKYSGTPDQIKYNVDRATEYGSFVVFFTCNYALVPHFAYYYDLNMNSYALFNHISVKDPNTLWYRIDDIALAKSDGMLVISMSDGVKKEIQFAKDHQIPIYYSVDDIPNRCPI